MINRITTFLSVGLLSACGGSSSIDGDRSLDDSVAELLGPGNTTSSIVSTSFASTSVLGGSNVTTAIGVVVVEQTSEAFPGFEEADASAFFVVVDGEVVGIDETLQPDTIVNAIIPANDVCTVENAFLDDVDFAFGNIPGIEGIITTSVSAGDVLTFTSPSGTYASVPSQSTFGIVEYSTDTTLAFPAPTNLTVNIPGDDFPGFNNEAVPDVLPLTGVVAVTGPEINTSSVIVWDAGSNPNARINLSFESERQFFNPLLEDLRVNCVVLDDGLFTFPFELQIEIDTAFRTDEFDINRAAFNFTQNSSGALLIVSSVSVNEGAPQPDDSDSGNVLQ